MSASNSQVGWLFIGLCLLTVGVCRAACSSSEPAVAASTPTPVIAAPAETPVTAPTPKHAAIGSTISLVSNSGKTAVFPHEKDFRECQTFLAARDMRGVMDISNERAIIVVGATSARVIDRDALGSGVRVRIAGGPHDGQDGWVFDRFVK